MSVSEKIKKPKKSFPTGKAGPGRPKGMVNKTTALLKDAILKAAQDAGGEGGMVGYLTTQATMNPTAFMGLLGKVLPMQVTGEDGKPIKFQTITLKALLPNDE